MSFRTTDEEIKYLEAEIERLRADLKAALDSNEVLTEQVARMDAEVERAEAKVAVLAAAATRALPYVENAPYEGSLTAYEQLDQALDAAFPLAKPERRYCPECHGDGVVYPDPDVPLADRCHVCKPTPPNNDDKPSTTIHASQQSDTPDIDDAAVQQRARELQSQGPDEYPWGFYLYLAKNELRSKACGCSGSDTQQTSGPSSPSGNSSSCTDDSGGATGKNDTPGELTDDEIISAYATGYSGKTVDPHTGVLDAHAAKLAVGLRAVADAQRERDRVRVSREDIYDLRIELAKSSAPKQTSQAITNWLRSLGVEVERGRA